MSSLVLLAYSCQEEQETRPNPTPGQNVQFGVSINKDSQTRTVYGIKKDNAFPIYWEQDDQVIVTSPQCYLKTGTYGVTVDSEEQDYATELKMIGNAGVQWGEGDKADFYSVYPAAGVTANGTAFSGLEIPFTQYSIIDGTSILKPDMNACFMSAYTPGVNNGSVVNLGYKPLSTAIRFTLTGPSTETSVTIQNVQIAASPGVKLSGEFTVDLAGGSRVVRTSENASNVANIRAYDPNTGGFLTLGQNEKKEFCMFVIPQEAQVNDEWTLTVTLSNNHTFTKKLGGATGEQGKLKPGMVHYLGELKPLDDTSSDWDVATWMRNIPRNVYLSEVSIPGSWNSLNKDFQPKTIDGNTTYYSIEEQYSVGVRAFHLDTRYNATREGFLGRYTYTITNLGIANGGSTYDVSGNNVSLDGKAMNNAPTFETSLAEITDKVKEDEYMVVFVTFAQNSATKNGETWEEAVSKVCAANTKVIMATNISSKTTVGDVLGRVIVIVNTETIPTITGSKCFFADVPLNLSPTMFGEGVYGKNPLHYGSAPSGIILYSSQCQVEFQSHRDWYNYDSQGSENSSRGYLPSGTERLAQLESILTWSKNNYSDLVNYISNNWIYLALGGYRGGYRSEGILSQDVNAVSGSYDGIASTYNTWIDNKVKAMGTNGQNYYPVGIILMNFVNKDPYPSVLSDILNLNNKYRLQINPDWEPKPTGQSEVRSAAPGYSSGAVDNNTNAINWE